MGAPGSGAGTQATLLSESLDLPAVGGDDVLRVRVAGTPLGARVRAALDAGTEPTDSDSVAMVRERLSHRDTRRGWLLHGFPHTPEQAQHLERWCTDCGQTLDLAILLGVPQHEALRRLTCRTAPAIVTAADRAQLQRQVTGFEDSVAPLLSWFQARGLLIVVDGRGTPDQVARRCLAELSRVAAAGRVPAWRRLRVSTTRGGHGIGERQQRLHVSSTEAFRFPFSTNAIGCSLDEDSAQN